MVAAIGEGAVIDGYALVGVEVHAAESEAAARAAWDALDPDVGLVILTPFARSALADRLKDAGGRVWAELPR
jgi:vacuolar-type H+-ATPase subunit F/Vma7